MAATDDLQSKAGDLVKKVLTVGVGAIFLTEESLRTLVSDIKLPKELLNGILDSAGKSKNEFLTRLSNDILEKVTAKIEPRELLEELLSRNEIEVNLRINLKPRKNQGESPAAESPSAEADEEV